MNTIEKGSGNVYVDLNMVDADLMLVKAQIITNIGEIIKRQHLPYEKAAETMGLSPSEFSCLRRGHFREVSETDLLQYAERLQQVSAP